MEGKVGIMAGQYTIYPLKLEINGEFHFTLCKFYNAL